MDEEREMLAVRALEGFDFPPPHHVQGRSSIADLFRPGKRCGLYILYFTNGEFYAGQAEDVTRRYVQHRKVHGDIERISFRRVAKRNLNEEERALIWELEQKGYSTRNITFSSLPKGESDFDLVMPIEEQDRWIKELGYIDNKGTRLTNPDLRRKYSRKFQHFISLPRSGEVIEVLRTYVQAGVPAFLRSELSFWACSCLPGYANPNTTIYSRVNINWQEVLTVFEFENDLHVSIHLALSPLEAEYGGSLSLLQEKYPLLDVTNHFYEPGGQDQINLVIVGSDAARKLLQEKAVKLSIRLFNLRLMKKGPCNFGRNHCMDLADKLVDV